MTARDRRTTRRVAPVRVFRLRVESSDDLSSMTTAEQRLEMVIELPRRRWELTGRVAPSYARAEIPVRVLRRS
jgi:hypothetical protein